jgi:hypothetical protein
MQTYSDPSRETDPYALPDIEVFQLTAEDFMFAVRDTWMFDAIDDEMSNWGEDIRKAGKALAGWYWHSCFPGCIPDSDPIGPFETAAEAEADAQDW